MKKKLIIPHEIEKKLKYYVDATDGEISGMGKVSFNEDKEMLLEDIIIFKQVCSSAKTELDEEAMAKFTYELSQKGEDLTKWTLWWHSHADMDVFWSTTDTDTMESHMGQQPYLVSLVTNKKGKMLARVDIFPTDNSPFDTAISYKEDEIDIEIINNDEKKEEIEERTKGLTEMKEETEKVLDDIECQIEDIEDEYYEDEELQSACEKEVEEKVSKPKLLPILNKGWWQGGHGRDESYKYYDSFGRRNINYTQPRNIGTKTDAEIEDINFEEQLNYERELDVMTTGIGTINADKDDEYEEDRYEIIKCPFCDSEIDLDYYQIEDDAHPVCPHCQGIIPPEELMDAIIKENKRIAKEDEIDAEEFGKEINKGLAI